MAENTRKNGSQKPSSPLSLKDLDKVGSLLRDVNRETKILATAHRALRGLVTAGAASKNILEITRLLSSAATSLETVSQELATFAVVLVPQVIGEAAVQEAHPEGNGQAPHSLEQAAEHRAEELLQRNAKDGVLKS